MKVTHGQFKGCEGYITSYQDGYITFMTEERKPFQVKVRGFQVRKSFKVGESVRIIQGNRSGESGIVTQLLKDAQGEDTHAVISIITDNHINLTVLINNLRIKTDVDTVNTAQYFQKNLNQETFNAGELIEYDNHKKIGLVIQTSPEFLTVLSELNQLDIVRMLDVSRKISQGKFSTSVDC